MKIADAAIRELITKLRFHSARARASSGGTKSNHPELLACVQALIICGWKDRDGIEGFIMLREEGGGRRRARGRSDRGKKEEETAEGARDRQRERSRREEEKKRKREIRREEKGRKEKGARRRPRREGEGRTE